MKSIWVKIMCKCKESLGESILVKSMCKKSFLGEESLGENMWVKSI